MADLEITITDIEDVDINVSDGGEEDEDTQQPENGGEDDQNGDQPENGNEEEDPVTDPPNEEPPEEQPEDDEPLPPADGGDVTDQIISEGTKKGKALPFGSHWHGKNWKLDEQIDFIEEGRHILPVVTWPNANSEENPGVEVPDGFERLADKGLPFSLIYGLQWTLPFWRTWAGPEYGAPENAMVDGKLNPELSPDEWNKLGKAWTQAPSIQKLQEIYPDPPFVQLYSNNERKEKSGADYGEQEKALFEGMREGLNQWSGKVQILGYEGVWSPWEGGSISWYQRDWKPWRRIHTFRSEQTYKANWVPSFNGLREDKWLEIICWNGNEKKMEQYEQDDQERTTPKKYRGWVQYALWMLQPRLLRQWNNHTKSRDGFWPTFKEILRVTDNVWNNDTLMRFWRDGELVPNEDIENPFTPGWFKDEEDPQFFLLNCNKNPDYKDLYYERSLKVFALVHKIDDEYLVYAHAPLGERTNVEVEVPGYENVSIGTVSESGDFFHIESNGSVKKIET